MIAVDSNILVYSVREDSPWHRAALACVRRLAEGETVWAIAWPCVHEFLAVVTHPRIYRPATSMREAVKQVDYWMESPTLRLLGEDAGYWEHLKPILAGAQAAAPVLFDAIRHVLDLLAYVRTLVDRNPRRHGQWLFTGSQKAPLMRGVTESMAGRLFCSCCRSVSKRARG